MAFVQFSGCVQEIEPRQLGIHARLVVDDNAREFAAVIGADDGRIFAYTGRAQVGRA